MAPFVSGLRARGVTATAIDLPKRKAEDALPAFHLVVPSAADVAVGGHSFGGRVASLAAAEPDAPYAALVLFSYPLHPPGGQERTEREYRELLGKAGFRLNRVIPTTSVVSIVEGVPV